LPVPVFLRDSVRYPRLLHSDVGATRSPGPRNSCRTVPHQSQFVAGAPQRSEWSVQPSSRILLRIVPHQKSTILVGMAQAALWAPGTPHVPECRKPRPTRSERSTARRALSARHLQIAEGRLALPDERLDAHHRVRGAPPFQSGRVLPPRVTSLRVQRSGKRSAALALGARSHWS
jgi:hypothetical protein